MCKLSNDDLEKLIVLLGRFVSQVRESSIGNEINVYLAAVDLERFLRSISNVAGTKVALSVGDVYFIKPDRRTFVLVGPDNRLVCFHSEVQGYIPAARNGTERDLVVELIGKLVLDGTIPYGIPLERRFWNHSWTDGCKWVVFHDAPDPPRVSDRHGIHYAYCVPCGLHDDR